MSWTDTTARAPRSAPPMDVAEGPQRVRPTLTFDRGTLLLSGARRDLEALHDLDVRWDPRTEGYRAPAWRYPALRRALGPRGVVDRATRYGAVSREAWSPVELRPYQRAALCAWEALERRGLVVLPTGSGKTRVAIAAMALTGASTLCLVPTRVLLHQWHRELQQRYRGPVGIWGDGARRRSPVMVTTFESAHRNMAWLGDRYELLVVDEAHHFGVGARDEALEMAAAPLRLGLTATPPNDADARAALASLIGPVAFRRTVRDLAGTFLADFDVVPLHLPLDPDERAAYDEARAAFRPVYAAFCRVAPEARWKDFVALAGRTREGRAALAAWRRARRITAFPRAKARALDALLAEHRGDRVLVFTSDNATAYRIARRNLVMPLTCDIKRDERDEALAAFRDGSLRALVSARVLNEGIDVPDAGVGIIVGGAMGGREHIQRVGRVLRPSAGKRAVVYELIADETSEMHQAERRRWSLGAA